MNLRMSFTTLLFGLLILVGQSAPAQDQPPRLIVRGDDMGAAHAVNEAIIQCHREGIQTAIEVIVPSPWFPEAVKMLAEFPNADVGVHLALSSEWDNVKWRPLTSATTIRDSDGYFFPMIFPNKNYPRRSLQESKFELSHVEAEFRGQIELALKHIPQTTHISAHMGCSHVRDDVKALVKTLAAEYRLDIDPGELGVKGVGYKGPHGTTDEKRESVIKMLESLEAGNTYLFVEHPGLDTPELRAIHHIGYENVAADRQGVTDVWTSPRVKGVIKARGIQLIGYRDLVRP
jgi:predicted glycoside hydrolase/deacetylase ChbG (UPF0249 family)